MVGVVGKLAALTNEEPRMGRGKLAVGTENERVLGQGSWAEEHERRERVCESEGRARGAEASIVVWDYWVVWGAG